MYLTFGNFDSRDYKVVIGSVNSDNAAKPYNKEYSVLGKNGKIIVSDSTFESYNITYDIGFYGVENRDIFLTKVKSELLSVNGYAPLIDSRYQETYRMASVVELLIKKTARYTQDFIISIDFLVQPQRYLYDGDIWRTVTGEIDNRTLFIAKPQIRFTTSAKDAVIKVGDGEITMEDLASGSEYIYDSETMELVDVLSGTKKNLNLHISGNPYLLPNRKNKIEHSGISSLSIKPRWWTI